MRREKLITSDLVGNNRFIQSVDMLRNAEIGHVVSIFRLSVNMIVAGFPVMAEAVEVLNAQIKSLDTIEKV